VAFEVYAYIVNLNDVRHIGDQQTPEHSANVPSPPVGPDMETAMGI
jgi:hypothetical protein